MQFYLQVVKVGGNISIQYKRSHGIKVGVQESSCLRIINELHVLGRVLS